MAARKYEQLTEVDDLDAAYQKWIYKQLEKRVVEYSQVDKVKIMTASWNVNAKIPGEADNMKEWLLPENTAPPDVYAIGLQEIIDLNVTNVVFKSTPSVEMAAAWVLRLSKILNEVDYYKVLLDKSMVGIMFVIFVKASLHSCIKDVKYALTYTGSYGVTGNKGGISISMKIHDSPLCFVCAHFHANRDAVVARNLDYQLICDNTEFISVGPEYSEDPDVLFLFPNASDSAMSAKSLRSDGTPVSLSPPRNRLGPTSTSTSTVNPAFAGTPRRGSEKGSNNNNNNNNKNSSGGADNSPGGGAGSRKSLPKGTRLLEHEYVFWLGDLNYRIDEEVEIVEIFERLYNESWETLRAADQLQIERARKNVFHGFKEGLLSFPPTYKYQPGTDLYETRPDKKLRAPAWCDRILWRSTRMDRDITMLHYRAAALHMSDHKPVSALFICNTHKIIKEKLKAVYADLLLTVDKWINASKPKVEATNRLIDFGPITYNKMYRAVMKLRNTGTVMAEWSFVPKNDACEVSKSWLKFSPMDGILAPDEESDVEVLVCLNLEEAYEIATTKANLVDDIAILRITNGSDLFCIVNAALTADTCAQVCSAFARAGTRQSDVTPTPSATTATTATTTTANGTTTTNNPVTGGAPQNRRSSEPHLTELTLDGMTLKISHASPVVRDK